MQGDFTKINMASTEKQKALSRKNYRDRKEKGLCQYCDNPVDGSQTRCKIHREIVSDYSAGRRDILKLKGLCTHCGKEKPRKDRLTCFKCAVNMSERNAKRRKKAKL